MNSIIEEIKNQLTASEDTQKVYSKMVKIVKVQKGQILQREGDFATKAYYVREGLLRSYTIDENGKEHIFMFAPEGWLIADNANLQDACDLFIDVLEDAEIEVIDKQLFDEKFISLGSVRERLNGLYRRIAVLQKRVIMLMSTPAIGRYEHFVATYPQILQRVPQKMIASYLGITPEALSKVKNQRKSNK
ncbi:MAG: Crp/Fnr family transcriptional regulator [Chitinophagales bacterium]